MSRAVFLAVVLSAAVGIASLVSSIVQPDIRVWPPPQRHEPAWRARLVVHRVTGMLVALAGLGALVLALADRGSLHFPAGPRWLIGSVLFVLGAGFGLWGYLHLGAAASQGALVPLEIAGPYRYSRNPQYVGAIGVLLGFGLLCDSRLGLLASAACSSWFVTAPFAEEPWLREHLGSAYRDYSSTTARFLGRPKRGANRET